MKTPILDNRTREQLMEQFARMAAEYVPEWNYTGDTSDPGAALAELFGEMFYQTVDRFNAVPDKLYTEFLNLLGVQSPTVTPAEGLVQFQVHDGVEDTVSIPAGSLLFAEDEEEEHITYETERFISATPARLEAVYFADGEAGLIQQLDFSREQPFFAPVGGENLQCHRFAISQNDVLAMSGPGEIELHLISYARLLEEGIARTLADPKFARWSWQSKSGLVPFDAVRCDGEYLILTKKHPGALERDENGRICIYCDMAAGAGNIEIDGVRVRSTPLAEVEAEELAHNDTPIMQGDGGYCFGRMPAPYDLFYIRSDHVFSKRGAQVRLNLDIEPIVYTEVDSTPQYEFGRSIIDKNDVTVVKTDDVFVREVVWEYYNGRGWANLPVKGTQNPFSGKADGALELRFVVPEDMEPVLVNAKEGEFIRARVVGVENSFSSVPKWILPFVKSVKCVWEYDRERPVDWIWAVNNAREQSLEDISDTKELRFEIYSDLAEHQRAMYLCFDRPLEGMPVSLMFDIVGKSSPRGKILYEVWDGNSFHPVRVLDTTDALTRSAPVYLYLPESEKEGVFFGRRGYWLRMSLTQRLENDRRTPIVSGIRLNVVGAVQRQQMPEQRFTIQGYEVSKTIQLLESPVMWCDVWVDEVGSITARELEELAAEDVKVVREDGIIVSCLVRWKQVPSLAQGNAEDRIYELDSHTGRIRFGDGKAGRVPPVGFENILVHSAYGGGSRGNQPEGAVNDFLVAVPRIAELRNITPMGGGTDRMDTERLERLGNRRIRHRGRAVGVRDYEEMILENFGQIAHVKCFSGMDENGKPHSGHLCVVVMGDGLDVERLEQSLCNKVYQFLEQRCDCTMVAANRLHVRSAVETTVNVELRVSLRDLDQAVQTQQEIQNVLADLIDRRWREREIGQQIRLDELYGAVKTVANVAVIERITVEGVWYEDGRKRVSPIEAGVSLPFAAVRSGTHLVRIS